MNLKESNINLLTSKISHYVKLIFIREISIGTLKYFGISLLLLFVFALLESHFYFNPSIKIIFIIILILFMIITLFPFLKLLIQYFKKPNQELIESASKEIGQHFPQVKDKLLNSIQLLKSDDSHSSDQLRNAAFLDVFNSVKNLPFAKVVDYSKLKFYSKFFLISVFTTLIFLILNNDFREATERIFHFNKSYLKPNEFSLNIFPGNISVNKNDNVLIKITANGNAPKIVELFTKNQLQSEFVSQSLYLDSNKNYSVNIRNIKNSFSYFAGNKNYKSDIFNIDVTSIPLITNLDLEIYPPSYSKLPKTVQIDNGNLSVLKGSKINFNLKVSKDILDANLVMNDSLKKKLTISKKNVAGSFTILNEMNYHFEVEDSSNNKNENPIRYSVNIIQDEFPQIEITDPDQSSILPQSNLVSINYNIKDDFGFSKCTMNYNISESEQELIDKSFNQINLTFSKSELEQTLFYNWDLSKVQLRENNIITFYIDIFDNDNISGPKQSRSNFFKIRIPSLSELFAEAENTQNNAMEDLTKTLKEAEELKKELNEIGNELKQNETKINWNEKERIEQAVKKFEEVSKKIEDVQENLADMQNKLLQNNMLSDETMKKYEELQNLFDELNSDELKKAFQNLNESLKDLMREKVQNAMENLSANEKMFQKSIERTMNLLKQIQIEQKIDELIKRAENITENLEELKKETGNQNSKNENNKSETLEKDQKNIDKDISDLKDEMQSLTQKMNEVEDTPRKQMEETNKEFNEQKNEELSQKSLDELQKQNFENAMQFQQQLSQNMSSMKNNFQNMQQQIQQKNQSMVLQNMLKAIDNLIDLSKDQEELKNKVENSYSQQNQYSDFLQNQMELQQNLDNVLKQMDALSQKTFAVSPEMGKALGDAKKNMMESLSGLQNKNGMGSTQYQNEAMKSLNEAASIMQNSLQSMMQGGGQGGGMMSLMQQLQQLAQQQLGLNGQTKMMQGGQLSMQQRAQLQRLAQQQGAVQKSLQDLNKEAKESSESKKLASNLESVLNDMKEVISGMNTQKIDDELIKKQDKILSKLLDAQKSINERDYEEKRESKEGKVFNLTSPEKIILSNQQAKDILREELLKSVKEGYSKDYQDLIRRYFESLNNNSKKN